MPVHESPHQCKLHLTKRLNDQSTTTNNYVIVSIELTSRFSYKQTESPNRIYR